jgi:rare lipoprotein A (peptidoglycan hydrolase)
MTTSLRGVANRTLPCGTKITFRNPANGRAITVKVVDRGPYVAGRQWDLTGGLCVALDHCYTGPLDWRFG